MTKDCFRSFYLFIFHFVGDAKESAWLGSQSNNTCSDFFLRKKMTDVSANMIQQLNNGNDDDDDDDDDDSDDDDGDGAAVF